MMKNKNKKLRVLLPIVVMVLASTMLSCEKDYIEDNVNIAITAVVSDHNDSKMAEINEKLSSVLYYNPFSKDNNLLAHSHALLLNKPILDIEEVKPKNAKEVLHLLDHSIIRYVNFKIYRIADLTCLAS